MSDEENNSATEDFAKDKLETNGYVCLTIEEGTLICLRRSYLKKLLDSNPTQKEFRILIQKPVVN